jgi:hypothetical protein
MAVFVQGLVTCDYSHCGRLYTFTDIKLIPLKVCANCRRSNYCDRKCQAAAWSAHKKECGSKASCRYSTVLNNLKDHALEQHQLILLQDQDQINQISSMPFVAYIATKERNVALKEMFEVVNDFVQLATKELSVWTVFQVRCAWFVFTAAPPRVEFQCHASRKGSY